MSHKGATGASLGGTEQSPKRRRQQARRRRRQEQEWAAKAGPVTVTRKEPKSQDGRS